MLSKLIYFILLASSVSSRHVIPRFSELDEEDQKLVRAAYETPSYDNDEYQEDDDSNKLDLLKDGLWALKAKVKELKALHKAMLANLMATKLSVKDLIESSKILKKHHHTEKYKPSYNYQGQSYQQYQQPQYSQQPQYHQPQYNNHPQYNQQPQYSIEYSEPQYESSQHTHDPYYGH